MILMRRRLLVGRPRTGMRAASVVGVCTAVIVALELRSERRYVAFKLHLCVAPGSSAWIMQQMNARLTARGPRDMT